MQKKNMETPQNVRSSGGDSGGGGGGSSKTKSSLTGKPLSKPPYTPPNDRPRVRPTTAYTGKKKKNNARPHTTPNSKMQKYKIPFIAFFSLAQRVINPSVAFLALFTPGKKSNRRKESRKRPFCFALEQNRTKQSEKKSDRLKKLKSRLVTPSPDRRSC